MKGVHGRVMNTDRPASDRRRRGAPRSLANSLDIVTKRDSGGLITVRARHLPVTESLRSRHNKAVSMSNIQKFDLREWFVPPVLVPLFFGLIIAGAVIIQS
jgi:hypothetical protein